jgi:hypothetical protein
VGQELKRTGGHAMKRLLATWARRAARRSGYELRAIPEGQVARLTHFPDPTDAIYAHGDPIFEVPARCCFYPYVFGYGPEGWHPFVQTLREVLAKSSITYGESTLHRFYQAFQPRTLREVLFETGSDDSGSEILEGFPADKYLPLLPWDPAPSQLRGEKGLEPSHGHQGYGPVSDQKGELEFRRLTDTMRSIELHGYRPAFHGDGEIRGYFLKDGGDYRFVIRSGLHRTAALVALGRERIRVGLFKGFPRALYRCDIDQWPLVRERVFSRDSAERYFMRFFSEDGRTKAARLGLLDTTNNDVSTSARVGTANGQC